MLHIFSFTPVKKHKMGILILISHKSGNGNPKRITTKNDMAFSDLLFENLFTNSIMPTLTIYIISHLKLSI